MQREIGFTKWENYKLFPLNFLMIEISKWFDLNCMKRILLWGYRKFMDIKINNYFLTSIPIITSGTYFQVSIQRGTCIEQ